MIYRGRHQGCFFILLFLFYGCILDNNCNSEYLDLLDIVIITQEGEVVHQTKINNDQHEYYFTEGELSLFNENYLYSDGRYKRIIDVESGEVIYSIAEDYNFVNSSANSKVFLSFPTTENINMQEMTVNHNAKVRVDLVANSFQQSSYKTDTLFSLTGGVIEDDKFETVELLALDASSNEDRLYYIQQNEMFVVTGDSSESTAHIDLYFQERSLWQYDLNTADKRKLLTFNIPDDQYERTYLAISKQENLAAFRYSEKVDLIDLKKLTVTTLGYSYSTPTFTDDERFLILNNCSTHGVYDIQAQEQWMAFVTNGCKIYNQYSVIPDAQEVVYLSYDGNHLQFRKADLENKLDGDSATSDEVIFTFSDYFNISENLIHQLEVSQPLVLDNGNILFIANYQGESHLCD